MKTNFGLLFEWPLKIVFSVFHIVTYFRILESDNHSEAEYMKQLILSVLYNICGRMQKEMEDTKGILQTCEVNSLPASSYDMIAVTK